MSFDGSNCTFIDTQHKPTIHYRQNPRPSKPPHVQVLFYFSHLYVPDYLPEVSQLHNPNITTTKQCFTQPLRVFDSDEHVQRAFQAMLARLQPPYEFQPELCQLHWGINDHGSPDDPVHAFDELVDRVSTIGASVVREAVAEESHGGTVKSIEIAVIFLRWTTVDAVTYSLMMEDQFYEDEHDQFYEDFGVYGDYETASDEADDGNHDHDDNDIDKEDETDTGKADVDNKDGTETDKADEDKDTDKADGDDETGSNKGDVDNKDNTNTDKANDDNDTDKADGDDETDTNKADVEHKDDTDKADDNNHDHNNNDTDKADGDDTDKADVNNKDNTNTDKANDDNDTDKADGDDETSTNKADVDNKDDTETDKANDDNGTDKANGEDETDTNKADVEIKDGTGTDTNKADDNNKDGTDTDTDTVVVEDVGIVADTDTDSDEDDVEIYSVTMEEFQRQDIPYIYLTVDY